MRDKKPLGLPAGFRDIMFEEARRRRTVETRLAAVFNSKGYGEVSPSTVEFLELYTRGKQHVRDEAIRFLDRNDQLLALRADFTPAVARIVGGQLRRSPGPIKAWYTGDVIRKIDPQREQFSEFGQVGAEIIGVGGREGDIEMIDLAMTCLEELGIGDVQVHLNHAAIFAGLIDDLSIDRSALDSVKSEIDRKDSRGLARRLADLGVGEHFQHQLEALSRCVGGSEVLGRAKEILQNEMSCNAIDVLVDLDKALRKWSGHLVYDLTEIDEMEYYTGVMVTFFSPRLTGELGKGGRYDTLLQEFGVDAPAVGFSFSMDRLVELA
ncbi:MAG: ATP phosphoribosyltransferase regulatory subunit [Bacteroidota bacterium]